MEAEIKGLKEEIRLLTAKVELLEKKERQRKTMFYVKLLLKIALICISLFFLYRSYEYIVNELPNVLEEKINELNPLKKYT